MTGPFTGDGSVICLRRRAAATTAHSAPTTASGKLTRSIEAWCKAHGYEQRPELEIYGHWDDDPSRLRTDVF